MTKQVYCDMANVMSKEQSTKETVQEETILVKIHM